MEIAERIAANNDEVTAIKNENADLNAQHDKIVQNYHRENQDLNLSLILLKDMTVMATVSVRLWN